VPIDEVSLDVAIVAGREISVRRLGSDVQAVVDGQRHATRLGTPLELSW
jgi:hypothetical protein